MYDFFIWRDTIEILFFSTAIYHLSSWLNKDQSKNLLPHFYIYCILLLTAYTTQLPTLTTVLLLYAPIILIIFIIMHQDTLQRNFIALKNIHPAKTVTHDWLETIIRSCLTLINSNKKITCVIECNDNLKNFISIPFLINADLHQGILDILLYSQDYDEKKLVWINTQGQLLGINGMWIFGKKTIINEKLPLMAQEPCQKENLFYSTKTDALIFHINPLSRTFTIAARGKQFDAITAHHTIQLIKKHIHFQPHFIKNKKGELDENVFKKNTTQQRSP